MQPIPPFEIKDLKAPEGGGMGCADDNGAISA